ncbi:MAG: CsbD family protein [Specibacter sp.]
MGISPLPSHGFDGTTIRKNTFHEGPIVRPSGGLGSQSSLQKYRRDTKGLGDKFDAAKDKFTGKVKETVGKATDDKSMIVEGKADQVKGAMKDKIADTKAHLKEDAAQLHTDDTEGGAPTRAGS